MLNKLVFKISLACLLLLGLASIVLLNGGIVSNFFKQPNDNTASLEKAEVVRHGDSLSGNGIPSAMVLLNLYPLSLTEEVKVGKDGKWKYILPEEIKNGRYNLTVTIKNNEGKIVLLTSYILKLDDNNVLQTLSHGSVSDVLPNGNLPKYSICDVNNDQCPQGFSCQKATYSTTVYKEEEYYCFEVPFHTFN